VKNADLHIETFVDRTFGENALVLSTSGGDGPPIAWVVDPSFPPQPDAVVSYLRRHDIRLERIIITHGHGDHIAGIDRIAEAHPEAVLHVAEEDRHMLTDAEANLSAPFGVSLVVRTPVGDTLEPGRTLTLGRTNWRVLDTSGHSPGGRSLYCPEAGVVVVGDALFAGSIGRTDFPGSDHHRLIDNIRRNLLTLPPETVVYSGHGPTTTIGNERKFNPFLSE